MTDLLPLQCRAARSILRWSQDELATRADVGVTTVADLEKEKRETTPANVEAIRCAFERAGVVFEDDGKWVGVKVKVKRGK